MKTILTPHILLLGLLCGGGFLLFPTPSHGADVLLAQQNRNIAFELNRAKNLARQAIEVANGGLGEYRAEPAMHGNPNESPYVENADGSYTFTFKGRRPESLDYTYESVVTVFRDERVVIDYNGAVRSGMTLINAANKLDLNQAKNLARQAAEEANGGLGNYRAQASMHGDARRSPHQLNADGSHTFTFMGRKPDSIDYTYETEVNVQADGTVAIVYNGAIREAVGMTEGREVAIDLNQAKNLARQAVEQANGGLGKYRAELSMHGNPNESPYVENTDGSYTFTFKGRRPESLEYTYESVVTVSPDGTVVINTNQAI